MRTDTLSAPTHAPMFIVGAQRSGTTLLRLMLHGHPNLHIPSELGFLVKHLNMDRSTPAVEEFRSQLSSDRLFRATGQAVPQANSYQACLHSIFPTPPLEEPQVHFCGGVIHDRFAELIRWWPDAKFIYLTRDPRDVARSVIQMGWDGNCWYGVDRWIAAVDEAVQLEGQIESSNWHQLSYEELVSSPVEQLTSICSFLDLSWNDGLLAYPATTTYQSPSVEAAFRWKTKATDTEVALVEAKVGSRLSQSGYESSGIQSLSVGPFKRFFLRVQNRLVRIRFRLTRYGFWNVAMAAFTTRFGPRKVATRFLLNMQQIDDLLMK